MRRAVGLLLAGVLAVGVIAAVVVSLAGRRPDPGGQVTVVHGVIGSEKLPFFQDQDVIRAFRAHGLDVQVDTAGSRQIATTVDLSHYDFAFPAGQNAAEKIRKDRKLNNSYSPFYTPMAIASFKPIAQLLAGAGVTTAQGSYYIFDMQRYLALVARNTRWSDLPNNTAYPAGKSILITSTDIRKSNSAGMYLALASYVANGNNVVQDGSQGQAVLPAVEPLFLRQGFTESSSEAPFDDYLSIGIGKTPMVMVYEAQYMARAAAKDGSITSQMVLMYPSPTVLSKHTFVPLTAAGNRAGQLLLNDPTLQRLETRFGFRTNDPNAFNQYLTAHGVSTPPVLVNVIEPPTYEVLEQMITAIEQRFKGATP